MRDSITSTSGVSATKDITTPIKVGKAKAPKPPKKVTTGQGTTNLDYSTYNVGIPEALQIGQAENSLQNNRALRTYQENAAAMQLKDNLAKIDRTSLDAYKGVADNYAARGMLRSGGYLGADDKAYKDTQDVKLNQVQNVQDMINTNKIQDTGEQQATNLSIQQLLSQILGANAANKLNQIKG